MSKTNDPFRYFNSSHRTIGFAAMMNVRCREYGRRLAWFRRFLTD
jgi:hypothetical protein